MRLDVDGRFSACPLSTALRGDLRIVLVSDGENSPGRWAIFFLSSEQFSALWWTINYIHSQGCAWSLIHVVSWIIDTRIPTWCANANGTLHPWHSITADMCPKRIWIPSKILRRLVHKIQHKELDLSLHDWITEFIHSNTTSVRGQPAGGTRIRTLANHKQTAGQYAKKSTWPFEGEGEGGGRGLTIIWHSISYKVYMYSKQTGRQMIQGRE